jgi:hypothetical protein
MGKPQLRPGAPTSELDCIRCVARLAASSDVASPFLMLPAWLPCSWPSAHSRAIPTQKAAKSFSWASELRGAASSGRSNKCRCTMRAVFTSLLRLQIEVSLLPTEHATSFRHPVYVPARAYGCIVCREARREEMGMLRQRNVGGTAEQIRMQSRRPRDLVHDGRSVSSRHLVA